MSSPHPVIWHEGLFVKPQHFQQQARAAEVAVQQRLSSLNDSLYGFTELQLNSEFLSFGKIAIIRARGIMPDGTVFDIPNDLPPPAPLEIADSSAIGKVVILALPLGSDSLLEVRWPEQYANSRYIAHRQAVHDTQSIDGDQVSIDLALPNLQLMLDTNERSAFTHIALGKILDKRPGGSLVMDENFYPTSLSLQAVPALQRYLGEVTGLMRARAGLLAERIASPGQSAVADVTDFNLLQTLNRLFPLFQHLACQHHVHPAQLYTTFAQACGELATFTDEGRLPQVYPAYQHDNLRESFMALEHTLRRALSTVLRARAVSLPIERQPFGVMNAPLLDKRLLVDSDFVVAARAALPLETLRQQFPAGQGQFHGKPQPPDQPATARHPADPTAGGAPLPALPRGLQLLRARPSPSGLEQPERRQRVQFPYRQRVPGTGTAVLGHQE